MFALVLIVGLFATDNSEFFEQVEKNRDKGMIWSYVGPQAPDGSPNLPMIDSETGEEFILFEMIKPVE